MNSNLKLCAVAAVSAALIPWLQANAADAVPDYVTAAIKFAGRPPLEIERDKLLKPGETMAFAGVKPGMNVADLNPDAGYYSRLLSKIVGPQGQVYMVVPQGGGGGDDGAQPKFTEPNHNMPVTRVDLALSVEDQPEYRNVKTYRQPLGKTMSIPKQVDVMLSAGDYHVFKSEFAKVSMAEVNKAIFNTMKNGGTYLVIDNAAAKGSGFKDAASLHRVDAEAVKAEILAAGFTLDGESSILAKTNDDRTKPARDAVYGDAKAPAELNDMFVLRFKKPANAPNTDKRPPNQMAALSGYFGNTRRGTAGATGNVSGSRERRVMYHEDGTYEEFGAKGTGNNAFQSGLWFYNADGQGCMLHQYPHYAKGGVNCSFGRAAPNKKVGDKWEDSGRPYLLVPGQAYLKIKGVWL